VYRSEVRNPLPCQNTAEGGSQTTNSLSIAEQVLTIATLFRNYELELYETTKKDVVMASSCMISLPGSQSPGIQVKVRKTVQ
jgi:hypothetical protein